MLKHSRLLGILLALMLVAITPTQSFAADPKVFLKQQESIKPNTTCKNVGSEIYYYGSANNLKLYMSICYTGSQVWANSSPACIVTTGYGSYDGLSCSSWNNGDRGQINFGANWYFHPGWPWGGTKFCYGWVRYNAQGQYSTAAGKCSYSPMSPEKYHHTRRT